MPHLHVRQYLEHYFAPHEEKAVKAQTISTIILDFAIALVSLFEPIYLHTLGYSIQRIMLFYIAIYVLYFLLLPIGGRLCRKHGNESTMLWAAPFLILYYLSLFGVRYNEIFVFSAIMAVAIYKILYWPGYHARFALRSHADEQGREVSNLYAWVSLATAFAPLVGGLVLEFAGFRALFGLSATLILASNIPLLKTPECFEPREFPYGEAFKRVFTSERRRRIIAALAFGEKIILLVVWPLFMITILPDYAVLGAVASLSRVVNIIAMLYVGRLTDEGGRRSLMHSGIGFTMAAWFARALVGGSFGIFLIDSFTSVARSVFGIPLVTYLYDYARRGHDPMAEVVAYEMGVGLGYVIAGLACIVIFTLYPNFWIGAFILAGCLVALNGLIIPVKEKA